VSEPGPADPKAPSFAALADRSIAMWLAGVGPSQFAVIERPSPKLSRCQPCQLDPSEPFPDWADRPRWRPEGRADAPPGAKMLGDSDLWGGGGI